MQEKDVTLIRLYVDAEIYEKAVGPGLLPDTELDVTAATRRLQAALAASGYDFVYAEHPEGHTWGTWCAHLMDALPNFFPPHNQ